jgi:hypothetical protein
MRFFDTYIEPSKIRYKITVDLIIKDFVFYNFVMKGPADVRGTGDCL